MAATRGDWVGRGTGVDDAGLKRKAEAVGAAVVRIEGNRDPLEVLRRLGGREIAAMVGAIIAARTERVPVIVDGFVTTAAAAVLHALDPRAIDHCLFAHCSAEAAHRAVLQKLGKTPLLDLGLAPWGGHRRRARRRHRQGRARSAQRHGDVRRSGRGGEGRLTGRGGTFLRSPPPAPYAAWRAAEPSIG